MLLKVRALPEGRAAAAGGRATCGRFTACALTSAGGAALALCTDAGGVYVLQLDAHRRRYAQLDPLDGAGATASWMARDRRLLFVAQPAGGVRAYDLATRAFATLSGNRARVRALSVRAAGEQLAAASADGVVLWDLATLQRRRLLSAAPYGTLQAAYTQDERTLVVAAADGAFTLWDAKRMRPLGGFSLPRRAGGGAADAAADAAAGAPAGLYPSCFCVTPDSASVVVGVTAPPLLLVYDLAAGALRHGVALPPRRRGVAALAPLPDGRAAVVLCGDGAVLIVDFEAGAVEGEVALSGAPAAAARAAARGRPGGAGSGSAAVRGEAICVDERGNLLTVLTDDGAARVYDLGAARGAMAAAARRRGREAREAGAGARLVGAGELEALAPALLEGAFPVPVQLGAAAAAASKAVRRGAAGAGGARGALLEVGNTAGAAAGAPAAGGKAGGGARAGAAAASSLAAALRARPLAPNAAAVSRRRLEEMLAAFREFPSRYRLLIWEHLLQLPRNTAAFRALEDRGVHPAFADLPARAAERRRRGGGGGGGGAACGPALAARLQRTLSQLAHWCPLFAESDVTPRVAFPFVQLFGANGHGALEAAATLLLHWAGGWFECFPAPPVTLLRRFMLLLRHHDAELGAHLLRSELQVPALRLLWHQLSGLMTDLLVDGGDWLAAWDHCLAWGPEFQYHLLAAYLVHFRALVLAAGDEGALERFFAAPKAVDVHKLLRRAVRLQQATPDHIRVAPRAAGALPRGGAAYPDFTEFPVTSVEQQAAERRRIQEAEAALLGRREIISQLEERTKAMAFEAEALTAQRAQLSALEAQRRAAARAAEDALASELSRLDDRSKAEKLRQIEAAERAYEASLVGMRGEWQAELAGLRDDLVHRRRGVAATLRARQEEEDLKVLEFQAQQRLWALEQDLIKTAAASGLRDQAAAQQAAVEAAARRKAAEWDAEDEARALARRHEAARAARAAAAAESAAAHQAAQGLLLAEELRAQEALSKVESERLLRRLAEDQADTTARQARLGGAAALQQEGAEAAAAAARDAIRGEAEQQRQRRAQKQQDRLAAIRTEQAALSARQAALREAAGDLERSKRLGAAAEQLESLRGQMAAGDMREAGEARRVLEALREERRHDDDLQGLLLQLAAMGPGARGAAAAAAGGGAAPAGGGSSDGGAGAAAAAAAVAAAEAARAAARAAAAAAGGLRRSASSGDLDLSALEGDLAWEAQQLLAARCGVAAAEAARAGGGGGGGVSESADVERLLAEAEDGIASAVSALGRAPAAPAGGDPAAGAPAAAGRAPAAAKLAARAAAAARGLSASGGTLDPVWEEPAGARRAAPAGARKGAVGSPPRRRRPSPAKALEAAGLSPLRPDAPREGGGAAAPQGGRGAAVRAALSGAAAAAAPARAVVPGTVLTTARAAPGAAAGAPPSPGSPAAAAAGRGPASPPQRQPGRAAAASGAGGVGSSGSWLGSALGWQAAGSGALSSGSEGPEGFGGGASSSEGSDGGGGGGGGGGGLPRGVMRERVSRLRRSSSATSEELEGLLEQLAAFESHLAAEASSPDPLDGPPPLWAAPPPPRPGGGGAAAEGARPARGGGEGGGAEGGGTPGSSVSWSQTLREMGLGAALRSGAAAEGSGA
ncbi:MAG: hypothetical protein J3K34DRAFT_461431 [Monoraphidium minutum]|nr:MAG: hypothetical protein J3K34DRAFT_461431 [Monoraphidium minutum]